MATTAFSALNTLLIGIFIKDLAIIAYWSVSLQLVNSVQNMYDPINKGIYPQMIKNKNLKFIGKVLLLEHTMISAHPIRKKENIRH
mgnify:CR=1 FL=1